MKKHKKVLIIAGLILFGILTVVITVISYPYIKSLSVPENQIKFKNYIDSLGFWGVIVVFLIQVCQIIFAFIPGEPIEVLAGVMYGTFGGLAICLVGILLGSLLIFLMVRKFGKRLILKLYSKEKIENLSFLKNSSKRNTLIFLLFFIPGTPKDLLTYFAGLTKIKMAEFLLISTFARIPSVITSTLAGSTISNGTPHLTLIIFLCTGIVGLLGIYINNIFTKKHQTAENLNNEE